GLAYLDSRQRRHGGWGVLAVRDEKYGEVVVGRSALALLAFLGAGHYPGSGSRYEGVTRRAIDFLVTMQLPNGHFGARSSAYSHGIATYALGEALLLSKDESLRRPLKRAVEQILRHQQLAPYDRRHRGGWSYFYQDGHKYDEYPRVSVTVWQLMALETARMGGIEVPAERLELAQGYLLSSWEDRMGRFLYNRDPERLASAYPTLPGSTPAAAFVLQVLGNDADIVQIRRALWMLAQHPPRRWAPADTRGFILRGQGNPYYWYYGTLALFVHGGDEWTVWNEALKDVLLPSQDDDGSWTPISVYANTYARDTDFDRSYTTALNVLMLEVYYRYLTPFQQAALEER
ncbi:MAG: prenyltransferase/squalene oxidase repeat-containing protein, partial [Planctomycetota bacterium]